MSVNKIQRLYVVDESRILLWSLPLKFRCEWKVPVPISLIASSQIYRGLHCDEVSGSRLMTTAADRGQLTQRLLSGRH
jgi:hypothetical protein